MTYTLSTHLALAPSAHTSPHLTQRWSRTDSTPEMRAPNTVTIRGTNHSSGIHTHQTQHHTARSIETKAGGVCVTDCHHPEQLQHRQRTRLSVNNREHVRLRSYRTLTREISHVKKYTSETHRYEHGRNPTTHQALCRRRLANAPRLHPNSP